MKRGYLIIITTVVAGLFLCCGCSLFNQPPAPVVKEDTKDPIPQIVAPKIESSSVQDSKLKEADTVAVATNNDILTSVEVADSSEVVSDINPKRSPYLLQVGDILEISILGEIDMTRKVGIIPDGTITYLLIGEVPAAEKTLKELRQDIEHALTKYYKAPKVSILLDELHKEPEVKTKDGKTAYASILGALKSPGKYELTDDTTLIDFIAEAGGFLYINDDMGGKRISNLKASYLSRNGKLLDIDFYRLIEFGEMEHNIEIKAGDFVYIANAESETIYVLGEVGYPRTIPFNRDISIIEAIAQSGGMTEQAQQSRVLVIRGFDGQDNIDVDIEALLNGDDQQRNIRLHAGDIVFVPEQGLSEYSRYAEYLTSFANLIVRGYEAREAVRFPRIHRRDSRR